MKMTKTLLTSVATAIACTITTYAEDNSNGKPDKCGHRHGPPKHLIEKFDKNGDGKLNKKERATAKAAMQKRRKTTHAKMLKRFDTDNDGKLSKNERRTARKTIARERKEIKAAVINQFDKDGDGKLRQGERKGVRKWVRENYPDAIHIPRRSHGKKGRARSKRGPKSEGRESRPGRN